MVTLACYACYPPPVQLSVRRLLGILVEDREMADGQLVDLQPADTGTACGERSDRDAADRQRTHAERRDRRRSGSEGEDAGRREAEPSSGSMMRDPGFGKGILDPVAMAGHDVALSWRWCWRGGPAYPMAFGHSAKRSGAQGRTDS